MTRALIAVASAAVAGAVLIGAAGASTNGRSGCGARPDAHKRWEVVFGTEKTRDAAQKLLVRVTAKHFKAGIEVESCTAFEVSHGRYTNSAVAQAIVDKARKAGFTRAKTEDS